MKDRLIGRQAIAHYLCRSVRTVDRWIRHRRLPAAKVGGVIEARTERLDAWLRKQEDAR